MLELIKESMLAGIGLVLKTKDEVEKLAKELIDKGKMSEKEGKNFLEAIREKSDDARNKMEKRVEKIVKDILKKMDVASRDELLALKKEIRELKKAISKETDTSG
ncbi:MAG: phasin family protein [Desulfobacterales bacterium]